MSQLNKTIISALSLLLLATLALPAQAFDCSKARSTTEKAICKNSSLKALDSRMSRSYVKAMNQISSQNGKTLRKSQYIWLASRNKCGSNVSCLKQRYNDWLKEYNKFAKKISKKGKKKRSVSKKPKTKVASRKSSAAKAKKRNKARPAKKKAMLSKNKKNQGNPVKKTSQPIIVEQVANPKVLSDS